MNNDHSVPMLETQYEELIDDIKSGLISISDIDINENLLMDKWSPTLTKKGVESEHQKNVAKYIEIQKIHLATLNLIINEDLLIDAIIKLVADPFFNLFSLQFSLNDLVKIIYYKFIVVNSDSIFDTISFDWTTKTINLGESEMILSLGFKTKYLDLTNEAYIKGYERISEDIYKHLRSNIKQLAEQNEKFLKKEDREFLTQLTLNNDFDSYNEILKLINTSNDENKNEMKSYLVNLKNVYDKQIYPKDVEKKFLDRIKSIKNKWLLDFRGIYGNKGDGVILTNVRLASMIQEFKEFKSCNIKYDYNGPYIIGYIEDVEVWIDPYLELKSKDLFMFPKTKIKNNTMGLYVIIGTNHIDDTIPAFKYKLAVTNVDDISKAFFRIKIDTDYNF